MHITFVSLLCPQKKHTVICLFSLLPFASIQKQERKRMLISIIAVGIQIAKLSAVRRANIWDQKIATRCSYLTYSAGESLKSQTQRSQPAKPKPNSPDMKDRTSAKEWVKVMGQCCVGNQRANRVMHKKYTSLDLGLLHLRAL